MDSTSILLYMWRVNRIKTKVKNIVRNKSEIKSEYTKNPLFIFLPWIEILVSAAI